MAKMIEPNLRERALYVIRPKRGEKAFQERMDREGKKRSREKRRQADGYGSRVSMSYGNYGASNSINSMVGWLVNGDSAEEGIDLHSSTLRQRSRDLFDGGGLARSAPRTMTTSVIGESIKPKPKIDGEYLGLSDEACNEWQKNTLREFNLWAESSASDHERSGNFYDNQRLAFLSQLVSGDCFVLFGMKPNMSTPYQLTIRLLEADRVSTPDSDGDSASKSLDSGGRIVDGVEIDKEGAVVKYYITNRHPLNGEDNRTLEWVAIDAFGKQTGQPNILHIMSRERPEQRRGVPLVAPVIVQIKQLDRYINSELASAVVSSMLAVFLQSEEDNGQVGLEDAVNENEKVTDDELLTELRPGMVYDLPPGKKINSINPLRANNGFKDFVDTMTTQIGAGFEIPKEVLVHKYDSNYTAARSALLDFWRVVRVSRTSFNRTYNQPIYEAWLAEAVATGRVEAPGFFDDPAIRKAWCGCKWIGANMGHVDPKKEIEAAAMRIALCISTQEQEAGEYNGGDWTEIVTQRRKEMAEMAAGTSAEPDNPDKNPKKESDEKAQARKYGQVYAGMRWPDWMPKISKDEEAEDDA